MLSSRIDLGVPSSPGFALLSWCLHLRALLKWCNDEDGNRNPKGIDVV